VRFWREPDDLLDVERGLDVVGFEFEGRRPAVDVDVRDRSVRAVARLVGVDIEAGVGLLLE
jgi:hypothetical protein